MLGVKHGEYNLWKLLSAIRITRYKSLYSKSIIFSGLYGVNTNIYQMEVATGNLTNLTNQNSGTYSLVDMSQDRSKMIYSYSDYQTPRDLYYSNVSAFKPIQLTDLNPGFKDKFHLATGETVKWNSTDGLEIEGVLHLPDGYSKKDKNAFLYPFG